MRTPPDPTAPASTGPGTRPAGLGPSTVLGYPRIGPRRELKRALESYWDGAATAAQLRAAGAHLRDETWRRLAGLGLAALPGNTFSFYDHMLDMALLLDAVPDRYRGRGERGGQPDADPFDSYFAMARGTAAAPPLPMTKWFDTNYHYLVPEIGPATAFRLAGDKPVAEFQAAQRLGLPTRPVLVGPVTFLLLSAPAAGSPAAFRPLDRLDDLLEVYAELLAALAAAGAGWVQLDEPALVADRTPAELAAVGRAYRRLGALAERPRLLVAAYFGDLGAALPALADTPVEAVGLDLVRGRTVWSGPDTELLAGRTVLAGVVSGRDVWRTDQAAALSTLRALRDRVGPVVVSTSCSLLHVPYDLGLESELDPAVRRRLAFAEQKVAEVVELADLLAREPGDAVLPDRGAAPAGPPTAPAPAAAAGSAAGSAAGPAAGRAAGPAAGSAAGSGRGVYPARAAAQAARLRLPLLPVTTIGSFPQTPQLRAARADVAAGRLDQAGYTGLIRAEIERVIRLQERLGLDVLVHGEPERNDMVQYFAEHLDGFAVTRHGWVQSYGSRCTRPPILYGDVARPAPITVGWTRYAQSLTDRPVKGMLTGPVTIAAWSFVRPDLPLPAVVGQLAEAVRAEVRDLEAAGVGIIQVDEPALRELMPLRRAGQQEYLDWAVAAYRRATSGAGDHTQIHTHLCYSDAADVLAAIDALDADVTSIESARSRAAVLAEPAVAGFARGLGPGVYDIHSPRVPGRDEVAGLLAAALRVLPAERVWVNPDCGLKTRTYPQVEAALGHLVAAAGQARRAVRARPAGPA